MNLILNIKLLTILLFFGGGFLTNASDYTKVKKRYDVEVIYNEINNKTLSFNAFDMALKGLEHLQDSLKFNSSIISVIDFSQASSQKRYYLIDLNDKQIIHQDYVAHGKNTGGLMAQHFSNTVNSYKSSLGFYLTAETYYGKHGLSLRLDGLEKGINDKARQRAIVIHAADYAEADFIKKYERLGRSFGCPALPAANYKNIIKLIKEGTLLFIYAPQQAYFKNSSILK